MTVAPPHKIGCWEWKCHTNGPDASPKSWRKYPLVVAQHLEAAYCAKKTTVAIPDTLMTPGRAAGAGSTYSVCFGEAALRGAMIQYQNNDPGKFRLVRRNGGDDVDRNGVVHVKVIPESESTDEGDYSESESVSSLSSSSSEEPKPKRRRGK